MILVLMRHATRLNPTAKPSQSVGRQSGSMGPMAGMMGGGQARDLKQLNSTNDARMMGDRADVIFADPSEISPAISTKCN